MKTAQSTPLYQQIKDYIRANIDSGAWPRERQIPSEHELVRELGASRMTVNRALRELSAEGRLRREQGVGTFVADPRPKLELLKIRNIADEIRERGHAYRCDVHVHEADTCSDKIAAALGLVKGRRVFRSLIVHFENGVPVQLEDRYVNPAVAPDYLSADLTRTTPNVYLMNAAPLREIEHTLEAILPDERVQALLDIPPAEPCLLLHRRTWSGDNVASRAWLTHPGSRYRLGARVTHDNGRGHGPGR